MGIQVVHHQHYFSLQSGKDFDDVICELDNGGSTEVDNLRIGLHIQGLGSDDDSVSAINRTEPVPEPATMALLGVAGMIFLRKTTL